MTAPAKAPRADLLPEKHLYLGRPALGADPVAYLPHPGLIAAANAALLLEAPLLLTGEPGCGKTQFAWAAARALGQLAPRDGGPAPEADLLPLVCSIRSDSRARDLLYRYDAVRRFSDAQAGGQDGHQRAQDPRNYVDLAPLGLALVSPRRRVVLLDEIDKAPRDLPNDLLNELDAGDFEIGELAYVPEDPPQVRDRRSGVVLRERMARDPGHKRPLVIITSNAESQLPDAFLRRCVFFHIPFPDDATLRRIIEAHCRDIDGLMGGQLLEAGLAVFQALRALDPPLRKPPGVAELLHFLRALHGAHPRSDVAALERLVAAWPQEQTGAGQEIRTVRKAPRPPWGPVPGLGCLVKLVEDQRRIVGDQRPAQAAG